MIIQGSGGYCDNNIGASNNDTDKHTDTINKGVDNASLNGLVKRNQTTASDSKGTNSHFCYSNTTQTTENNISVNNINGFLHMGPSYTYAPSSHSDDVKVNPSESTSNSRKQSLSPKEKEHIRNCWKSKRVIHDDEVLAISKNVGRNWKDVGKIALTFEDV